MNQPFNTIRLDEVDIIAMRGVHERKSIPEIAVDADKSIAWIHRVLTNLEESGLVEPPPRKNAARSRTLTQQGKTYMEALGYIPRDSPFAR